MANFKRKKCRRQVKCNMCTDARVGNADHQDGRSPRVSLNRSLSKLKLKEGLKEKD